MKHKIFQGSLGGLVLVAAFFAWFSVDRAIRVPEASTWFVPAVWFSLLVVFLSLFTILAKNKYLLIFLPVIAFCFTLFFSFNLWHVLILIVGILLLSWALYLIRNDLGLNITISIWKSLLTGKSQLIFALALVISSQYFFTINKMDGQKIMPKLDINPAMIKAIVPLLGTVNPSFKGMEQEGLTVDQYLLKVQAESGFEGGANGAISEEFIDAQIPANIPAKQRELLKQEAMQKMLASQTQLSQKNKELILKEGRRQFSEIVGQQLTGDEKITDILAAPISRKINEYLQPPVEGDSNSALFPMILTLILFLTIAPLGSILSRIWFLLVIIFFKLFLKTGLVEIKKIQTQKEIIL